MTNQAYSEQLKSLRIKALQLAMRCEQDEEFAKQLSENPRSTVEAHGIPPEFVNSVIGKGDDTKCFLVSCILTDTGTNFPCACCLTGSC